MKLVHRREAWQQTGWTNLPGFLRPGSGHLKTVQSKKEHSTTMTATNENNALAIARHATDGKHRTHRIRATTCVQEENGEVIILVVIPKTDLEGAKPGTGGHRGVGFSLYTEVDLPEGTFALSAAWVSIIAR